MYNNDFFFQNTALMAALTGFPNLEKQNKDELETVMNGYDNVSKEQVMKHLSEFDSKEELEHYVHNLAIRNKEIHKWE
ncbi:MAG: hypothetical protein J6B50_01850 [Lachnospiraceae bacterium]|nr:hypothetical protein [Lachnospiraceae bacterium]